MKIYTIGYGGRNPKEFIDILQQKGIKTVVDVRLRPDHAHMGLFKKSKSPEEGIQGMLSKADIGYVSLIELGNIFIECEDWSNRYRRLLDSAGELLTQRLKDVSEPYCLLCAEKSPPECHRYLISEYLTRQGHEIEHL